MSAIQLGDRTGGLQAPRRETLLRLRYGKTEAAATLVVLVYAGLAVVLVGGLGLGSPEAMARTARLGTLWDGFDASLLALGFDRPPLLTLIAAPFAAFPVLREGGLAAALATALTAGLAVHAATGVAHRSGLTGPATALFVLAFAFHPLLLFAGVVGLPETLYASLVLIALSSFGMWLHRESVSAVIGAGVAIGVAFVVRYDSVFLALAMAIVFWRVAAARARDHEADAALAPMLAFCVPVAFMVGLWSLISWFPRGELGEFLRLAAELSRLGGDQVLLLDQMRAFADEPFEAVGWVARWSVVLAPASVVAVAALLGAAVIQRSRESAAMAVVCAAVLLPPLVSVASGHGQPLVSHLFVAVVPAFAILGYRELRLTRGRAPSRYETPRRRAQLAWCGLLFLASMGSAGALWVMPETDRPVAAMRETLTGGTIVRIPADVLATAEWIRANGGPGDYLVDTNRHAEVMIATAEYHRFRTDADRGGEAVAYDPFGLAEFILLRQPLPGQGPGRLEQPYPEMYDTGSRSVELAFEAGEYRIYRVTGPALP